MTNSELLERFRELEARLQKVNTELDGLRVAIKGRTFTEKKAEIPKEVYEVGEYVRVKSYEGSDEFMGMVTDRNETPKGFFYLIYGKDKVAINVDADMIEKWEPKKGDLCIFGDKNKSIKYSIIAIFNGNTNGLFRTISGITWDNCIPFLSEQQYKIHIGYEK